MSKENKANEKGREHIFKDTKGRKTTFGDIFFDDNELVERNGKTIHMKPCYWLDLIE
ncbi:MAG: hypothetical protein IKQ12_00850 [Prevotella sp.]|nr:hypothetical protein [Prevotella sp.]